VLYLVWPVLLVLAFRRRLVLSLLVVSSVTCLGGAVVTVLWLSKNPGLASTLPSSWAVCFVIGAASALVARRGVPVGNASWAVVLLVFLGLLPLGGQPTTYLLLAPAVAVLACVALLEWRQWQRVERPSLQSLAALGEVSYAAYLVNYPLSLWIGGFVAVPVTIAVAHLVREYVEEPVRRRFPLPARVSLRA
jgi:peptidoglycan/LPS O-acetylase OafA/YrhL